MTQKMQVLIVNTSEAIVTAVDDCLLGTSKRNIAQRLLTQFAQQMETEFVAVHTPAATPTATPATPKAP